MGAKPVLKNVSWAEGNLQCYPLQQNNNEHCQEQILHRALQEKKFDVHIFMWWVQEWETNLFNLA